MTDEVIHGQCAVEENTEAFDSVRERDCGIVKLKGVDRNRGQFLSCSGEHRFCLLTIYLKFVLRHPVCDVQITFRCGFQKSVGVFR